MVNIKVLSSFLTSKILLDKSIKSRIEFCYSYRDFFSSIPTNGIKLQIVYFPLSTKLTFEDMYYLSKAPPIERNKLRIYIFYGQPFHLYSYWTNFFKENFPLLYDAYTLLPFAEDHESISELIDSFFFFIRISMYCHTINIDFYDLLCLFENSGFFFWITEKDIIQKEQDEIVKSMVNRFMETCNLIGISKEIERYQESHKSELPTDTILAELVFHSNNKLQFKQVEELICASLKPFRFDANAIWGTGVSKFEEQIEGIQLLFTLKMSELFPPS